MGNARNLKKALLNPAFSKDFGKCVLEALFKGWYKICYYHGDLTLKQRLSRKLSAINKEILYLEDQLSDKSTSLPRSGDYRKYWEKMRDIHELKERKQAIIMQLRDINRDQKK